MQDKAVCRTSQVTSSPAHQAVWPDVSLHWLTLTALKKQTVVWKTWAARSYFISLFVTPVPGVRLDPLHSLTLSGYKEKNYKCNLCLKDFNIILKCQICFF